MMLLYLWNLPETESMRKEENKQMARHICFMTTKLSAKEKFLLFLMVIFKNLILSFLVFTMILQAESAREMRPSINTRMFVSLYTRIFVVAPSNLVKLLLKTEIEIYFWSVGVQSNIYNFYVTPHFTSNITYNLVHSFNCIVQKSFQLSVPNWHWKVRLSIATQKSSYDDTEITAFDNVIWHAPNICSFTGSETLKTITYPSILGRNIKNAREYRLNVTFHSCLDIFSP